MKKLMRVSILLLFVMLFAVACSSGPGDVVEQFFSAIEEGNIDEAVGYLSTSSIQSLGEDKWRSALADLSRQGEIGEVRAVSEEINGELAVVTVEATDPNGSVQTDTINLIMEDGEWKIDMQGFGK